MSSRQRLLDGAPLRYGLPLGLDLGAVALAIALHDGLSAFQASARFTGRVSLLVFAALALLYAAPALRQAARKLMAPFAAVHFFHLICLASYLRLAGGPPPPARLLGGGLAYLMILTMPFTLPFLARIGPRRRRVLESVYLGWVGFIFLMSYVTRVAGQVPGAGGSRGEHIGLLCAVLATTLAHFVVRLRAQPATVDVESGR